MKYHYYLLDSSFWIDLWKDSYKSHPSTLTNLAKISATISSPSSIPMINGIILAETLRGLTNSKKDQKIKQQLHSISLITMTIQTYKTGAELARQLDRKGLKLQIADCLIAATAIENNATLVTKDKHFSRFPKLKHFIL